ncbi:hypothetical protein AKJ37_01760 [candidate division MSBL1 archaeon SCGC-AAA259I09]|uniref:(2Fe-2S)-binding protein n=2 Tax=candidate division MSBL1 TaxID=215777 RepID=A0A133UUF4_9EURY|nr:hypothetical protein AKJ38_00065 [candidate division MSBL1 archaeon SCGC-AAA259I14]KXA97980.1 hypothetical protein AKJ37_01760 [candidate division MSBL1 archaeon SCGC-AAA259I09]
MSEIELMIDGKEIVAERGQTVLEVASENGIDIPTHCYKKPYEPAGFCRICVVEVQTSGGKPELQTACTYPAQEGLEVKTNTERVKKSRKLTAELMLARCPDSEAVKELAEEVGVKKTRFSKKNKDCTLCGLCVRACKTVSGDNIITFVGRGPDRKLITPFELSPEECKGCGACAEVCPTKVIEMVEIEEVEEK